MRFPHRQSVARFTFARRAIPVIACACALAATLSCATQSRFTPIGSMQAPAKPEAFNPEVFQTGLPQRPFERIARLDVHMEKTHFLASTLNDALPDLKQQARLAGADAIVEIEERRSWVGETRICHVTATGVRYTAAP